MPTLFSKPRDEDLVLTRQDIIDKLKDYDSIADYVDAVKENKVGGKHVPSEVIAVVLEAVFEMSVEDLLDRSHMRALEILNIGEDAARLHLQKLFVMPKACYMIGPVTALTKIEMVMEAREVVEAVATKYGLHKP